MLAILHDTVSILVLFIQTQLFQQDCYKHVLQQNASQGYFNLFQRVNNIAA